MAKAAEVVRSAFELANANAPERIAEVFDPEVEFHDVPEVPGSTIYRGHDGIRDWLRTVHEISDDLYLQIWEMEEKGDVVLVETSAEMHGQASGAEVGWRFWTVWRVRDDLIVYHHGYSQRQDAVADFKEG